MNRLFEHHFRAMNTGVAAWLWTREPLADLWLRDVQRFFAMVEAELSRFRATSGLSRLNAAAGRGPQLVSPTLLTVLARALTAARASGGLFDPTVLADLHRAGYDRSFEQLPANGGGHRPGQNTAGTRKGTMIRQGAWQQVVLDPIDHTVTLPAGVGLDLGGITKGWAVDRAVEMLSVHGAALVDAGGDIRVSAAPGGKPWPIAVADPFDDSRDVGILHLSTGAVATSTVGRRHWQQNGRPMHHLIDPRNGQPSQSDLHTVTVIAPTAVAAEVAAKVALIRGRQEGRAYLEAEGWSGLLVGYDGTSHTAGRFTIEPGSGELPDESTAPRQNVDALGV